MSIKEILQEHSGDEIAESMMIPERVTARQKKVADQELAAHRAKRRELMTDEGKLKFRLAQLKLFTEKEIHPTQKVS